MALSIQLLVSETSDGNSVGCCIFGFLHTICFKEEDLFSFYFLCLQREDFQMYEKYCQNKPRSESLWRQYADSLFFQVGR